METPELFKGFNVFAVLQNNQLLPAIAAANNPVRNCIQCNFINRSGNNFCTHCGYPIHPNKDNVTLYNYRLTKRKALLTNCLKKISQARNALYLLATFSMLGIVYLFSDWKPSVMKGLVMIFLGLLYAGLAKWSEQKPFTALLISLIVMLTFTAINTWAEINAVFTTAVGVYMLFIQVFLTWFLLQGVKGAFHADLLEEEFKM